MFGSDVVKRENGFTYVIAFTTNSDGLKKYKSHLEKPIRKIIIGYYGDPEKVPNKITEAIVRNTTTSWKKIYSEIQSQSKGTITEIIIYKEPEEIYNLKLLTEFSNVLKDKGFKTENYLFGIKKEPPFGLYTKEVGSKITAITILKNYTHLEIKEGEKMIYAEEYMDLKNIENL